MAEEEFWAELVKEVQAASYLDPQIGAKTDALINAGWMPQLTGLIDVPAGVPQPGVAEEQLAAGDGEEEEEEEEEAEEELSDEQFAALIDSDEMELDGWELEYVGADDADFDVPVVEAAEHEAGAD
jgi:hypothetical protein